LYPWWDRQLVLSFLFEVAQKNNIKFQNHINRVQALIVLKKSYISYVMRNIVTFYTQVVDLNEIYKFIVLSFSIWDQLNIKKQYKVLASYNHVQVLIFFSILVISNAKTSNCKFIELIKVFNIRI